MDTNTIKVEGMSCGHCKMSIESALTSLEGVNSAVVNLSNKTVEITFNKNVVNLDKIKEVVEDQGFDVYL
ncbi:copper chaperone CopZ [Desulfuribacillus alkaliarsenatis]|uniref:Copper chaperone CopZ n=1 Tax=Desulfuribacillus alkaliarsenatis TaxID=766136 RepID=A0A1E5G063_9FIRM|nr:copper chaperone CopZ [Desulfuribacillus alkaliarsenatis]OEF96089.1 hypothetical protein BHF68_10155 [Desulfuribacillus alkaliarsenatis]